MTDKIIRFKSWDCTIEKLSYAANKQIALQLNAANTENNLSQDVFPGEPIVKATVCIPDFPALKENQTFIDNSSEKEGILAVLVDAGVVKDTGVKVPLGYITANLVEVLI